MLKCCSWTFPCIQWAAVLKGIQHRLSEVSVIPGLLVLLLVVMGGCYKAKWRPLILTHGTIASNAVIILKTPESSAWRGHQAGRVVAKAMGRELLLLLLLVAPTFHGCISIASQLLAPVLLIVPAVLLIRGCKGASALVREVAAAAVPERFLVES